jgi:hypothetical protein
MTVGLKMVNYWPKLVALHINLIKYILNVVLDDCSMYNIIVITNTTECPLPKNIQNCCWWFGMVESNYVESNQRIGNLSEENSQMYCLGLNTELPCHNLMIITWHVALNYLNLTWCWLINTPSSYLYHVQQCRKTVKSYGI